MISSNNSDKALYAFHHAARVMPFYSDILRKKGVLPETVTNYADFVSKVPIVTKEEIFPQYPIDEMCQNGATHDIVSAIVSSGTTGVFSYGLLTERDIVLQRQMFDSMMELLFDAKNNPPIIINALPMGVSFVSSYPIIPTSVRTDIVLHVLRTLGTIGKQFVIVTDPNVLKKLLEEGIAQNFPWPMTQVSCVIGGSYFSESFTAYAESILNGGSVSTHNHVFGTFGVTEVALNIFGSTPDLHAIRHSMEEDVEMRQDILGMKTTTTPEIMYTMSPAVHVEICDMDEHGVGDIVVSHLDTELKTVLIRYRTGDRGKFLDTARVGQRSGIIPILPLQLIALFDRFPGTHSTSLSAAYIKQRIYAESAHAKKITGNFIIESSDQGEQLILQMKSGITEIEPIVLENASVRYIPYIEFPRDVEINYENKWKHFSQKS